jgi:hypothetical protein
MAVFATSYKPLAIRSYPHEIRFTRNVRSAISRRIVMNSVGRKGTMALGISEAIADRGEARRWREQSLEGRPVPLWLD